jgi:transcriptional regulator with XRE-family HTH domain
MRSKQTALALGAAAVLASGAYALGTQVGGGSAGADDPQDRGSERRGVICRHMEPPDLGPAAEKLGVSEEQLETALREAREERRKDGDKREDMAAALAKELGVSTEKVTEAMRAERGEHRDDFAARLAKELGVEESKVSDALDELREDGPRFRGPGDFAADLAKELGVEESKVESALREARPRPPFRRELRRAGSDLAERLGVSEEKLREAFEKVGESNRNELYETLGKKLGKSADEVEEALGDLPVGPIGPRHGIARPGHPSLHGDPDEAPAPPPPAGP